MSPQDYDLESDDEFGEPPPDADVGGEPPKIHWNSGHRTAGAAVDSGNDDGEINHTAPPPLPRHRNTILIAGRQASGKSVYIARLYAELDPHEPNSWRRHAMRLHARKAGVYQTLQTYNRELSMGRWPRATTSWTELDLEVEHPMGSVAIKYLDYPGEVFTRAFTEQAESEDADRLRAALFAASHVILLIDIAQLYVKRDRPDDARRQNERADNTSGMVEFLRQLRDSESLLEGSASGSVPVSIILTKADSNRAHLAAAACLASSWLKLQPRVEMLASIVPAVLAAAQPAVDVDAVSAASVRQGRALDGSLALVPDLDQPPINLVEGFKRIVHRDLLRRLESAAMAASPDSEQIRVLLDKASACKLHHSRFREVRIARSRLRSATRDGVVRPGARLHALLKQLHELDPEFNQEALISRLRGNLHADTPPTPLRTQQVDDEPD
jgi:hypothetical protein